MRRFAFFFSFAILAAMSFLFFACGSDDETVVSEGSEETQAGIVSGVAQKGQLLRGSSVTIYALDKNLNATGLSYPTQTTDDLGSFAVSNVKANFIDVKANGYYYNENKGANSESTINLQALAASNSNVNVNILTTLAYNRIKHLVKTGLNFSDAQNRAQIEVLTALGLGNSMTANFTEMNIAGSGDSNGLLLAASLLIQQDRSVGDVSKLISDIAADLEEDGQLSNDLNQEIHKNESYIYAGDVINGLIEFYEKNKVENFNIPTFYKFLDTDGDGKMDGTAEYIFKEITYARYSEDYLIDMNPGLSAGGFSFAERFLSTVPFKVESDAAWIKIEKRTIVDNIYDVDIIGEPNTGENRAATVTFINNSGKELAKYTYQQKAPEEKVPQRFIVATAYNQGAEALLNNIGVNGRTYSVVKYSRIENDFNFGYTDSYWYVDIPYGEKSDKYQLYFPTHILSMPNGYGTYKLNLSGTITSYDLPFLSQLNGEFSNPAYITFGVSCPSIYIGDNIDSYDHIVITSDQPICGSATYQIKPLEIINGVIYEYDPQIMEQESQPDGDGKYRLTVQVKQHGWKYIPVLLSDVSMHVQCYSSIGQLVNEYDDTSHFYRLRGQFPTDNEYIPTR